MPPRARKAERPITRQHAVLASQNVGRRHGYAIARHGSLIKDVDLIAVPWVSWAHPPGELAQAIADALPGVLHKGDPVSRPHGRLCWTITLRFMYGHDHWWVDLSVMPRTGALPRRHKSELPGAPRESPGRAYRPLHIVPPRRALPPSG